MHLDQENYIHKVLQHVVKIKSFSACRENFITIIKRRMSKNDLDIMDYLKNRIQIVSEILCSCSFQIISRLRAFISISTQTFSCKGHTIHSHNYSIHSRVCEVELVVNQVWQTVAGVIALKRNCVRRSDLLEDRHVAIEVTVDVSENLYKPSKFFDMK